MAQEDNTYLIRQLEHLNTIGVALSAEHNHQQLLEMILLGAQQITNADGGTLYTITNDHHLKFEMMCNKTLGIAMGGTTGVPISFPPLPLYLENKIPNLTMVAACAALQAHTVNIQDAYQAIDFDFSGTRKFDQNMGYRSQSFLTIPMKNHESEVIGVLQLINAIDANTGEIIPFSPENQSLVESLASQAAIAMTNHHLIEGFKNLFESFIKLIADAIDQKSPYTGGHCRRVPELAIQLTQAAINTTEGPLKDFYLSEKELYELKVASWLHDCGKVTTPESVMDKPRKLSAIFDRIELIDQRFELLKQQAENQLLKSKLALFSTLESIDYAKQSTLLEIEHQAFVSQCNENRDFLRHTNYGSEFMSVEDIQRVDEIALTPFKDADGKSIPFLSANECEHLKIARGTLSSEEREIINNHIVVTINMLEALPYPKSLARVPEYACGHHERMDGRGYPKGLTKEQMSIPARIMGIADIFEALTSRDRPYKKAKTLSESLTILGRMKVDHHIDPDLFDLFVRKKIYLKYAQAFLEPEQIDEVDLSKIPGYQP